MTFLKIAAKKTKQLNQKKVQKRAEYNKFKEKVVRDRDNDIIGLKGAQDQLYAKQQEISEELNRDKEDILRNLDYAREKETENIKSAEAPVTADMLAEIQMLNETMLEGEDISQYVDKYKHTPLALRKLKAVAAAHKNMEPFPQSKTEGLEVTLANIQSRAETAADPQLDRGDAYVSMFTEDIDQSIDNDLNIYDSL